MDKEMIKAKIDLVLTKAKAAQAEIKDNFKPTEGSTGGKKVLSMFVNLWKSGVTGKVALIVSCVFAVVLLNSVVGGGDVSVTDVDTLVVKGLYMRMPGDEALKACQKLVSSSKDIVVVDYRKGLFQEKDAATKAGEKAKYEAEMKKAEADVERFLQWESGHNGPYDPNGEDCVKADSGQNHPSLAGTDQSVAIPGPNHSMSTAKACLAAFYGYQLEWMIPAKRVVERPKPELLIESIYASARKGEKLKENTPIDSYWYRANIGSGKNYDTMKEAYYRLSLQTENGQEVDRAAIVRDLGLKFKADEFKAYKREKAQLQNKKAFDKLVAKEEEAKERVLAQADKALECLLKWSKIGIYSSYEVAVLEDPSDPSKGLSQEDLRKYFNVKGAGDAFKFPNVMTWLAQKYQLKVERATVVEKEPVYKMEQITGMVTNLGNTVESACKIVSDLNYVIGRWADKERKALVEQNGLVDVRSHVFFRLVLKTTNGVEVAKEDAVKNWFISRGHNFLDDMLRIEPQKMMTISIKQEGVTIDEWPSLCFVYFDEEEKVRRVYFNERGMNRFFDAGDISGEEFAHLLVKNYSDIPELEENVKTELPGRGKLESYTWNYKDPRGYQVQLFERAYFGNNGQKYSSQMIENDAEVAFALSLADKLPTKHFEIFAIKPESSRKFD